MVSTNYSPYFQPLPSQEVRVMPYVEPPFLPTTGEAVLPYKEYTVQDKAGTYTVNVNLLHTPGCITIEHVANGNLLMRIQIIREKIFDVKSTEEYLLLSYKYTELYENYYNLLSAKRDLEHQRWLERANNQPIIIIGDFVVKHGTNIAIATKNALIATGETVAKTARVARENISKLVFFCSYALVCVKPSAGSGGYCEHRKQMDKGKSVQFYFQSILERQNTFKQDSQNTSCSSSLIAQLLCNEKKM